MEKTARRVLAAAEGDLGRGALRAARGARRGLRGALDGRAGPVQLPPEDPLAGGALGVGAGARPGQISFFTSAA